MTHSFFINKHKLIIYYDERFNKPTIYVKELNINVPPYIRCLLLKLNHLLLNTPGQNAVTGYDVYTYVSFIDNLIFKFLDYKSKNCDEKELLSFQELKRQLMPMHLLTVSNLLKIINSI